MAALFPDPRRIVTGHDSQGKSIIVADSQVPCLPIAANANFAVLYETQDFPALNDEWVDPIITRTTDLANKRGIILRVVDIPPKSESIFHRTESLDFGILYKGEITCLLDDGVGIEMKEGDVCVQRGTIHGWINNSANPARIYFILTAAFPVKVGEKSLGNAGYSREDIESGGDSK